MLRNRTMLRNEGANRMVWSELLPFASPCMPENISKRFVNTSNIIVLGIFICGSLMLSFNMQSGLAMLNFNVNAS